MRSERESTHWLELYALAVAAATWGSEWRGKKIEFHCDSQGAVDVMRSGTSRSEPLMDLIRSLFFIAAQHGFVFRVSHIAGTDNSIADALSRLQLARFKTLCPSSDPLPTRPLPLPARNF